MNDAERFWAKVDKTCECWEWTGCIIRNGYGQFWMGKHIYSHRYSYIIHHPITIDLWEHREICVCHRCDNRKCVNPAHLFLGSCGDNMKDCVAKGRWADVRGAKNPFSKLTEKQVREIRTRYATGNLLRRQLALEYGITTGTIKDIIQRRSWKHI